MESIEKKTKELKNRSRKRHNNEIRLIRSYTGRASNKFGFGGLNLILIYLKKGERYGRLDPKGRVL